MTTNLSGPAKIYAFPPRGRFAAADQTEQSKATAGLQLPRGVMLVSGSGWYHEAAIQEAIQADRTGKN